VAISFTIFYFQGNMKTSAEKAFLFDANGEGDSEGGTYIQPRDPGKLSFSSENTQLMA
jgi:hypothetical protein